MSDRYYSGWDKWFAEEHDGTPCEWLICEGTIKGDDEPNNTSLCATMPHGHKPLAFETHRVLHRFMASSYIEACNKQAEILGWGPYKPHPGWNPDTGLWNE